MVPLAQLNVKLAPRADAAKARRLIAQTPGVTKVAQTFPEEKDEELARLYVLHVDAARVEQIVKTLRNDAAVDFVEAAPVRKLIRPRK